IGVVGLAIAGHENMGGGLGTASVVAMIWYRSRSKRAKEQVKKILECSKRRDACETELRKTEGEAREIEGEIRKLIGKNEITPEDIDHRVADLDRLLKLNDEARNVEEAVARCEADLARVAQQINDNERSI